jgi:hypothetical protein
MPLEVYPAGTALDCSRGHRICPSCVRGRLLPAALSGGGGTDAMSVGERSALQLPFCTVQQARRVCEAWQARVEQRAAEAATAVAKTPATARALDDRSNAADHSASVAIMSHLMDQAAGAAAAQLATPPAA